MCGEFSLWTTLFLFAAFLSAYSDIALSNLLGTVRMPTVWESGLCFFLPFFLNKLVTFFLGQLNLWKIWLKLRKVPFIHHIPSLCLGGSPSMQLGSYSYIHTYVVVDRKLSRIPHPHWSSQSPWRQHVLEKPMGSWKHGREGEHGCVEERHMCTFHQLDQIQVVLILKIMLAVSFYTESYIDTLPKLLLELPIYWQYSTVQMF